MIDPIQRFRAKVGTRTKDGCLPWLGSQNGNGYGQFAPNGRKVGAHTYAYVIANGPVPPGHELHHTCGHKDCVNAKHLVPQTRAEHNALTHPRLSHCQRGHSLANAYVRVVRICRQCRSDRQSERDRQRRAAAR